METGQVITLAVAAFFLVWYVAGTLMNRNRAVRLIRVIREALDSVGRGPTIRWYGRSIFEIAVAEPGPPLEDVRLLCLLEPREFPLALAWNRLRGRRDQVLIQAAFHRPPRVEQVSDPHSLGIRGLTDVSLKPHEPHLRLTLQVSAGGEAAIAESFAFVRKLADRP